MDAMKICARSLARFINFRIVVLSRGPTCSKSKICSYKIPAVSRASNISTPYPIYDTIIVHHHPRTISVMLRTSLYLAVIATIFLVRSSDAANCTSTSFNQQIATEDIQASITDAVQYATATKEQIISQLTEKYKDTIASIDFQVTETEDSISIAYKVIFACDETTTIVMPDGSSKVTNKKSSVSKDEVEKTVSAGQ